jgi:Asp-tRNA(Asn)/Glu-tRNA(Gln) amidotransferase A subunit family amidase
MKNVLDRNDPKALKRREFMAYLSAWVLAATPVPTTIWAQTRQRPRITKETLAAAETMAGVQFTDEEREMMLEDLQERLELFEKIRSLPIPSDVPPAVQFDPVPPDFELTPIQRVFRLSSQPRIAVPGNLEELAFLPVTQLSRLVQTGQVSSVELTQMYLDRLVRHGSALECVVTITEELAMQQARRADNEIASGRYRGPLHGIPWGAKDLLAVRGYPTTWGAKPYEHQEFPYDATVVRRLEEAGAVLIAKLAMGALAFGDVWFGGKTRNPWNLEQGSGGSSSGPAAATAAGLVAFSIGTETRGSILGPSARCGTTGLRPTFGRVSRHGVMALSWSMDKIGPICRSVEDCALVLRAIQGPDGNKDPTVRNVPFNWDATVNPSNLRVAYLQSAFEEDHEDQPHGQAMLRVLRSLGARLVPIELPDQYPFQAMLRFILDAEEGAAFDDLTRSGRDDLLVHQEPGARPDRLRKSHFIPGVEYLLANRLRTMLIGSMQSVMDRIDVFVAPRYASNLSLITNLTGHPAIAVPSGFREDGTPVSMSFVGRLYGEAEMLALAMAYQDATGYHMNSPPRFS